MFNVTLTVGPQGALAAADILEAFGDRAPSSDREMVRLLARDLREGVAYNEAIDAGGE